MTSYSKSLVTAVAVLLSSTAAGMAAGEAVTVHKTPLYGCCHAWAEAVEKAGYRVTSVDLEDLSQMRKQAGIPADMEGRHVAAVEGYFREGHVVPLEAIEKLRAERPAVRGLAVPGMPRGPLGMGEGPAAVHDIYAFPRDAAVFH